MDRKKQEQKRRRSRDPDKKHNCPTSKRRHNSRWEPRPRNKMDHPRDQTKKHSYRSLLRTSRRRKDRQNERNLQHAWNTNPAKTEETRYNPRRRLQRKTGGEPNEGKTKPIKKRRNHEKTTAKNRAHPNKHQRWPRNMDQSQQKKTGGKIYHRLHTHLQRNHQTDINYSGWGRTPQS